MLKKRGGLVCFACAMYSTPRADETAYNLQLHWCNINTNIFENYTSKYKPDKSTEFLIFVCVYLPYQRSLLELASRFVFLLFRSSVVLPTC